MTMRTTTSSDPLVERLVQIVGAQQVISDPEGLAPHLVDWRGRYRGSARCLVKPGTTGEVAEVVGACAEARAPMVPQGGHTSLVGASVPGDDGHAVIVSTRRLNRIRDLDAVNNTITVEAGCVLQSIQEAAAEAGRLFPLSLAAEGSCQIGGNLAANAGGINVLRYGNARAQVLGLEAVLPDGRIWDGLRRLRKDNTGYDLKQLFIGSEGTLGIITAAVLRLYAQPRESATAFVAVRDVKAGLDLLNRVQDATGQLANSCELMPRAGIDLALAHVAETQDPLEGRHDWYVLLEVAGGQGGGALAETLKETLIAAYEAGEVLDAAPAENAGQAQAFWHLREGIVEAQRLEGASIKHDVAVPVSRVPEFLERALAKVEAMIPGVRPVPFGHLGDGSLHFNLTEPTGADSKAFLGRWEEVNRAVHDIVHALGGTISAEHGIGQMKVAENIRLKPAVEIDMMRAVKRALDPHNIMNPGKVIDV